MTELFTMMVFVTRRHGLNLSKFLQSHAQPSEEFGPMLAPPKMYSSRLIRLGFIEETRSTDLWPTLR